ncbi:MAG: 3-phosphoshikimate 1-carboxyvinyltransferase [Clostridia bacterium]|nr:3-phosphoshikimate 1-carboxyvinyltransferase [Clostridia bacterium]
MRTILPRFLSGSLGIMPSKSASHRALICAALAGGESVVVPIQPSLDVEATLACLEGMGLARVTGLGEGLKVTKGMPRLPRIAPCGESGSTLRFLMPLALDGGPPVRFEGTERLLQRPLDAYRLLFARHCTGYGWVDEPGAITINGQLHSGDFTLPGNVSSQFVSGLLFALPRLQGDSTIRVTGEVESRGYIDLTLAALARSGFEARWLDERTLDVPGGQRGRPGEYPVEGDWSHAAFYLVAGLIGGPVRLTGLDADSLQGDRAVIDVLRGMGGDIRQEGEGWAAYPSALHGTSIDASQIPDLVPALAVAACAAQGRTVIYNAARLRIKESDRLAALRAELGALGAAIKEQPDGLVIHGTGRLQGGSVNSHNDHRIAMALAVAAALCDSPIELAGSEAVQKSAPYFWDEYAQLTKGK